MLFIYKYNFDTISKFDSYQTNVNGNVFSEYFFFLL